MSENLIKISAIYNNKLEANEPNIFSELLININTCEIYLKDCYVSNNNYAFLNNVSIEEKQYNGANDAVILNFISSYKHLFNTSHKLENYEDHLNNLANFIFHYIYMEYANNCYHFNSVYFSILIKI